MSDFKNAATPPPAEKAVIDSRSSTSGDDSTSSPTTGKLEGGLIDDEEYRRREKALVWKIDKNVIPFLTLLFMMSFLDRINIGVAKLNGLEKELGLNSLQYSIASLVFFSTYVAFEIPSNMLLKRFRPSRWISFLAITWGITMTCMGLVTNFGQLVALRVLLGMLEAGLFPAIVLVCASWYPRREVGLRTAICFSAATLAGAFGGILGYAIGRMSGVGGKLGWSWIFIIEGLLTVIIACFAPWLVHDFPEEARFLTEDERAMVLDRLRRDAGVANTSKFTWGVLRRALADYKLYLFSLVYVGCAEPIYSQALFLPQIVASLGKWTQPQSLLLSVPPYAFAFCTTLATAFAADRFQRRAPFLIFWSSLACVGYIIFLSVKINKPGVLYFASFLTVGSIAPCIATSLSWFQNNLQGHYKKAFVLGTAMSVGNSGGIWSSLVYRTKDKPDYIPGHSATLAFSAMCLLCTLLATFLMRRENHRRDALYGPPPPMPPRGERHPDATLERLGLLGLSEDEVNDLGDDHPAFRYTL